MKTNLLEGRLVIERAFSEINGELIVIRDITYGTYIRGGGLPQSGGLAEIIWKSTLRKVRNLKPDIESNLIIGLGGGSIAKLIRKDWPNAKITGVDIDPVIVNLGKKYLKLDGSNVDIFIEDAERFINKEVGKNKKYDLICFDTYVGDTFPKRFESVYLIEQVKKILSKNGIVIFNRLYGSEDRDIAINFEKVLLKVFDSVDRLYPEANIMFVCRK